MAVKKSKILEPEGVLLLGLIPERRKGPPLLFIHGRHGSAHDWQHYLEYFSSRGWPSYALSLRGHFGSRAREISEIRFPDFLQDVRASVEEIGEVPVLVGFSMGGRVIQKYAETCPARGLVLLNSTEPKALLERIPPQKVLEKIPPIVYPEIEGLKRSIGEEIPEGDLQEIYSRMRPESGMVLREMFSGIEVDPSKVRAPVFVVDTDSERKCQKLAEFYRADSSFLQGIGHGGVIWGRRWKEVAEVIYEWINERFSVPAI